ncbi:MAG: hypothetical protein HOE44_10080 [Candidatus Marinimicrobia bacterium]|nr:hypothetical protein [Candidatus Neomarinimicrobiota bacterium]MBT7829754.1 hypothetical protein [Candidatus Neomarinimicrobiota bacterium]
MAIYSQDRSSDSLEGCTRTDWNVDGVLPKSVVHHLDRSLRRHSSAHHHAGVVAPFFEPPPVAPPAARNRPRAVQSHHLRSTRGVAMTSAMECLRVRE